MIILDPERAGCHVWAGDNVTYVHGNPKEVCDKLYERLGYIETIHSLKYGTQQVYRQVCTVGLDVVGIGQDYYQRLLVLGLKVQPIKPKHIDGVLPILLPRERYVL